MQVLNHRMKNNPTDIDILLSAPGDFIETRPRCWKYKTIESLADVSGELVSGLGLIVIASFVIITFTIGLASYRGLAGKVTGASLSWGASPHRRLIIFAGRANG